VAKVEARQRPKMLEGRRNCGNFIVCELNIREHGHAAYAIVSVLML
jgi:hypothetical protein